MAANKRIAAAVLSLSAAALGAWMTAEGFSSAPIIPTKGDVPTIGHGSTQYESGRRVTMQDAPISRQRARELAANLLEQQYVRCVRNSLSDTLMHQVEFDVAADFAGQYGCGNWQRSSMLTNYKAGNYRAACNSYLKYRFAAGYDCSTPGNTRCMGVWTRQLKRHADCTGVL